jgi:protein-disulfide isomerase
MTLTRRSLLAQTSLFAALAASGGWAYAATTSPDPAAPADAIKDFALGSPDAKVKIAEYLSFTCPHCAHFHTEVFPKLKAEYIDTGKVMIEYHEVYFDQMGLLGAMLARCGGEMRYFGLTDMLLDKQPDWAAAESLDAAVLELKTFARAAGMVDADVDACLQDQKMAEALVAHYQANIAKDYPNDSFGGTPSFIINGTQHKNMSFEELKVIIDTELAK